MHNLTSIILLHACQLAIQTKAPLGHCSQLTHTHTHFPKEISQTHAYVWAQSNSFTVTYKCTHTHTCALTYMWCSKGHTFSAGQGDNASDLDKQLVVKVAGYKSGAGRNGLLSTGDWELLSTVSVTGKVNKSFGAMCIQHTVLLRYLLHVASIYVFVHQMLLV